MLPGRTSNEQILGFLRPHCRNDRELIWNATVDAVLLDYILHPARFDPSKSGLLGYLKRLVIGLLMS